MQFVFSGYYIRRKGCGQAACIEMHIVRKFDSSNFYILKDLVVNTIRLYDTWFTPLHIILGCSSPEIRGSWRSCSPVDWDARVARVSSFS